MRGEINYSSSSPRGGFKRRRRLGSPPGANFKPGAAGTRRRRGPRPGADAAGSGKPAAAGPTRFAGTWRVRRRVPRGAGQRTCPHPAYGPPRRPSSGWRGRKWGRGGGGAGAGAAREGESVPGPGARTHPADRASPGLGADSALLPSSACGSSGRPQAPLATTHSHATRALSRRRRRPCAARAPSGRTEGLEGAIGDGGRRAHADARRLRGSG